MANESTLRFGAQTDEETSLLRIVNLVRTGEASTRPEIGRLTGLGRGVVAQRVDRAIEAGFLVDGELGPSSGGRAPRNLQFRVDRARILVCALGALHMHIGITDLSGRVLAHSDQPWDITQGPEPTLDAVTTAANKLLGETPDAPIWSVVVGLPGPVDFATGMPVAPPIMPGWNSFDVRGRFEELFHAPVWVDNDVNLLALSERARRNDAHIDLIFCKIGSGIGAGLLSQGKLHRGANGAAGDIGHVRVLGSDERCRCGKIGCLEAVASGWALVRNVERAIADGAESSLRAVVESDERLAPEQVMIAANHGDALALTLVQEAARTAGEAIATLVNMFNPSVIVIGGAIASAGEVFLAEVRQRVYELSLALATRDLQVTTSEKDITQPVRGGAQLAIEQLFDVTFPRWFAEGQPTTEHVLATA